MRRRQSSANRVLNQLRAAFNLAFEHRKVQSDQAWRRVSGYRDADAARVRYLSPLLVVAKNLGHSDRRMVEKHYGHLAPSYIADAIRQHAPRFGTVASNVKSIR